MTLSIAEMESRYDAMKDGSAYIKPVQYTDRCCPNGTPTRDCPACTAKIEAERQQVHAHAAAATTARERVEILLDASEIPNGDQLFDLLLEDEVVGFIWYRAIDWVLWRQAHGKPVKVLGDPDCTSASIDARFDHARAFNANITPHSTEADVALACAGDMIERWERTPEQEAEIQRSNDLVIAILEAIDGGE